MLVIFFCLEVLYYVMRLRSFWAAMSCLVCFVCYFLFLYIFFAFVIFKISIEAAFVLGSDVLFIRFFCFVFVR